jgi:glycerophosphoryl diester phosphodiesterase
MGAIVPHLSARDEYAGARCCAPDLHLRLGVRSCDRASLVAMEMLAQVDAPAVAPHRATTSPIVIAHRGAPGYRPEHTLASYRLAIAMGADGIEPDLVSTKDGALVVRHENEIGGTTDVAEHPEFAGRKTTRTIDGRPMSGWFTEDFTLAELKTLRAEERLPQVRSANTAYDGRFEVATFDEILDLVAAESRRLHRQIAVYPEIKHPSYFASIGLPLETPLIEALRRHHLDRPDARVYLQSFDTAILRRLSRMTRLPLIQLIDASGAPYDLVQAGDPRTHADLATAPGLAEIATYAAGVGVHKELALPRDAAGNVGTPSALVDDAHAVGLLVHVWTLRAENRFMASNFTIGSDPIAFGDAIAEVQAFLDAGIDGFFTDHADVGVEARDEWLDLEQVS